MASENKPVVDDAKRRVGEFLVLLNRVKLHQQQADRILAVVDEARAKAAHAVELGQKTLQFADQTLATVQGKRIHRKMGVWKACGEVEIL